MGISFRDFMKVAPDTAAKPAAKPGGVDLDAFMSVPAAPVSIDLNAPDAPFTDVQGGSSTAVAARPVAAPPVVGTPPIIRTIAGRPTPIAGAMVAPTKLRSGAAAPLTFPSEVLPKPDPTPAGPYAAQTRKDIFGIDTPDPLRTAPDATRLQPEANPYAHQQTGLAKFATNVFGAGASVFEHPAETVIGSALAIPKALKVLASPLKGQKSGQSFRPGTDEPIDGGELAPVTAKEKMVAAAQLATVAGAGPAENLMREQLAKIITQRVVAKGLAANVGLDRLAAVAARMAATAPINAAFNPDHPFVGAAVGAIFGAVHAGATGARVSVGKSPYALDDIADALRTGSDLPGAPTAPTAPTAPPGAPPTVPIDQLQMRGGGGGGAPAPTGPPRTLPTTGSAKPTIELEVAPEGAVKPELKPEPTLLEKIVEENKAPQPKLRKAETPAAAAPAKPTGPREYVPESSGLTVNEEQLNVRNVARGLKTANPDAIATAAPEMAARVPPRAILVPIPDHQGSTVANKALADAMAALGQDVEVHDVLGRGEASESSRELRQKGKPGLTAEQHAASMKVTGELPTGRPVVLIDNLETTGATAEGARRVLERPNATSVTYAKAPIPAGEEEAKPAPAKKPKLVTPSADARALGKRFSDTAPADDAELRSAFEARVGKLRAGQTVNRVQDPKTGAPAYIVHDQKEGADWDSLVLADDLRKKTGKPEVRTKIEQAALDEEARRRAIFFGHDPDEAVALGDETVPVKAPKPEAAAKPAETKPEPLPALATPQERYMDLERQVRQASAKVQGLPEGPEYDAAVRARDELYPKLEAARVAAYEAMKAEHEAKASTKPAEPVNKTPGKVDTDTNVTQVNLPTPEKGDTEPVSTPSTPATVEKTFRQHYEDVLRADVEKNPRNYVYGVEKVPEQAERMMKALAEGNALWEKSPTLKAAAKAAGIPFTQAGLAAAAHGATDDEPDIKAVASWPQTPQKPGTILKKFEFGRWHYHAYDAEGRPSDHTEVAKARAVAAGAAKPEEKPAAPEKKAEPPRDSGAGVLGGFKGVAFLNKTPSGKYHFNGGVHGDLAYINKTTGGPPTKKDLDDVRQAGPGFANVRSRVFDSPEEALAAADALGQKVGNRDEFEKAPGKARPAKPVVRQPKVGHPYDEYTTKLLKTLRASLLSNPNQTGIAEHIAEIDAVLAYRDAIGDQTPEPSKEPVEYWNGQSAATRRDARKAPEFFTPEQQADWLRGWDSAGVSEADVEPAKPGIVEEHAQPRKPKLRKPEKPVEDLPPELPTKAPPTLAAAEAAGRAAFDAGEKRLVPREYASLFGKTADPMAYANAAKAWYKGWDTGNLAPTVHPDSRYAGDENPEALLEGAKEQALNYYIAQKAANALVRQYTDEKQAAFEKRDEKGVKRASKKLEAAKDDRANADMMYVASLDEIQSAFGTEVADRIEQEIISEASSTEAGDTGTAGTGAGGGQRAGALVGGRAPAVPRGEPAENVPGDAGEQKPGSALPGGSPDRGTNIPRPDRAGGGKVSPDAGQRGTARDDERGGAGSERASDAGADTGTGPGDRAGGTERVEAPPVTPETAAEPRAAKPADGIYPTNFKIDEDTELAAGGPKARIRANIDAIKLARRLAAENRAATPEEQKVLARYVGWGASELSKVFDEFSTTADKWEAERNELKALLTPEEYAAASKSTQNAHYTSPEVIRAMYAALAHLGITPSAGQIRMLEPGAGIGHFLGLATPGLFLLPTLVELDPTTAAIAKGLYPKADVQAIGFQDARLPESGFDLVVGNPPFARGGVADPKYDKYALSIHNYFFVKALDALRPGGVLAFVTSHFTMDAMDSGARKLMQDRGQFLGAVRLPNTAFKQNAGTSVVTDVLFFRKPSPGETKTAKSQPWLKVVPVSTPQGPVKVNEYFRDHVGNVIGTHSLKGSMRGGEDEYTVEPYEKFKTGKPLQEAMVAALTATLPPNVYTPAATSLVPLTMEDWAESNKKAPPGLRDGWTHVADDGRIMVNVGGFMVPAKVPDNAIEKVKALIGIREAVVQLRAAQLDPNGTDEQVDRLLKDANKRYDAFVKSYGPINKRNVSEGIYKTGPNIGKPYRQVRHPNYDAFKIDSSYPNVMALEVFDEETGIAKKADTLLRRVLNVTPEVSHVDTPEDALAPSLNKFGRIDLPYMAQLAGVDETAVANAIRGKTAYENPESGQWELTDQYLSGNVKEKLAKAKDAARDDQARYGQNVDALTAVIPKDLEPREIFVKMGAPWVSPAHYAQFASETFHGRVSVKYVEAGGGSYIVTSDEHARTSAAAETEYGTPKANGLKRVFVDTLNMRSIEITWRDRDGRTHKDVEATLEAQAKQAELKQRFSEWIWEDGDRAIELARIYNDTYNNSVAPKVEGRFLQVPGTASHVRGSPFEWTWWQKDAIWRIATRGNTLLAHVVGAGKTFVMVAAGMEMRRLGLARKPLYVVPNHMLEQFSREFLQLYPQANVLIATKRDFEKKRRREFTAKMASQDWDAIIMTHRSFEAVPVSRERQEKFIRDQQRELRAQIEESKRGKDDRQIVKALEAALSALDTRLRKLLAKQKKDDLLSFEETGGDQLFVDEAHLFKNGNLNSRMRGMAKPGSQRAFDLALKCMVLDERTPGRGVVFATGTPISNSMAEMYIMQRYLQPQALRDGQLENFDQWAATFGESVVKAEIAPDGSGYRQKERFSNFMNIPELITMFRQVADVKLASDIFPPDEPGKKSRRPPVLQGEPKLLEAKKRQAPKRLRAPAPAEPTAVATTDEAKAIEAANEGRPTMVLAPASMQLKGVIRWLMSRAERLRHGGVDPSVDNFLNITTIGRFAAMDLRLISPYGFATPGGKVEMAADRIVALYKEHHAIKGTQLVFSDIGTPKDKMKKVIEVETEEGEAAEDDDEEQGALAASGAKVPMGVPGFNVYDELRQMLVERGIPVKEIAFIHDAKNNEEKQRIMDDVKSGKIRVLMGSTEKMGAGMNVQDRIVANHDLDAPWRPSDVEQRLGRAIRQGNLLWDDDLIRGVALYRYGTEGSFDAYMWQTLERKAGTIGQVMSGDATKRSIEDLDSNTMDLAEMKAATSGNPLVKEKNEVDTALDRLERAERQHRDAQIRVRAELALLASQKKVIERYLDGATKDAARAEKADLTGNKFEMVVGRKAFTGRLDALAAMREQVAAVAPQMNENAQVKLGRFGDFDIILLRDGYGAEEVDTGKTEEIGGKIYPVTKRLTVYAYAVALDGTAQIFKSKSFVLKDLPEIDPVASMERQYASIPGVRDSAERELEANKARTADFQTQVGKPFTEGDKIAALAARQKELATILGAEESKNTEVPLAEEGSREWWSMLERGIWPYRPKTAEELAIERGESPSLPSGEGAVAKQLPAPKPRLGGRRAPTPAGRPTERPSETRPRPERRPVSPFGAPERRRFRAGGEGGGAGASPSGEPTGIKNVVSETVREELGLGEREAPEPRTQEEMYAAGKRLAEADPTAERALLDALRRDPEKIVGTEVEAGLLLKMRVDLDRKLHELVAQKDQAANRGDTAAEHVADLLLEQHRADIREFIELAERTGTATGRALAARRMMSKLDYSLSNMESTWEGAKGAKLTKEELERVRALHDALVAKLAIVERDAADARERAADAESKLEHARLKLEVAGPIADRITSRLDNAAAAAMERIRKRGLRAMAGLDPEELADYAIVGAAALARGAKNWAEHMVSLIGKSIEPHLDEIREAAIAKLDEERESEMPDKTQSPLDRKRNTPETVIEKMRVRIEEDDADLSQLRPYLRMLALDHIRSGIVDREEVLDALHEDVQELVPGVTRTEVRDALSGYGDFRPLNKDPDLVRLREISAESQKLAQLEAWERGEAAMATGFERQPPNEEIRQLQKLVNEAKRKAGLLGVVDQAGRLKSALASAKTRTRNLINDLATEIDTGRRFIRGKSVLVPDAELTALKDQLAKLREIEKQVFKKPGLTDAERLALAIRLTRGSLKSWDDRLAAAKAGKFGQQGGQKPALSDPTLDALKAQVKAARAEYEELKSLDPAQQQEKFDRTNIAYRARLAKQEAELRQRIASGDYERRAPRPGMMLDEESRRRRAAVEQVKQEFRGKARDWERARRPGYVKAADYFASWVRAGVLTSPVTFARLTGAAIARTISTPVEQIVGYAISQALPRLAASAPRHGVPSLSGALRAEAAAQTRMWTEGIKGSVAHLRNRQTTLELLHEQSRTPPHWSEYMGMLHAAFKNPVLEAEYARSYQLRTEHALRMGINTADPVVHLRISNEAYLDGKRAIFRQKNIVTTAYRSALSTLERPNKDTGKVSKAGVVVSAALRTELPIVGIPTNFVAEIMELAAGLPVGAYNAFRAYRGGRGGGGKKGPPGGGGGSGGGQGGGGSSGSGGGPTLEDLNPIEADAIMRQLEKGAIGAALMLLGFFLADKAGGLYMTGQNKPDKFGRDRGKLKPGEIGPIGKQYLHNPFADVLQVGASVRKVSDSFYSRRDRDPKGLVAGIEAAAFGLLDEVPFVRETSTIENLLDEKTRDEAIATKTAGIIVPLGLQWIAKQSDDEVKKPHPMGLSEHIQANIPGLRQRISTEPVARRRRFHR